MIGVACIIHPAAIMHQAIGHHKIRHVVFDIVPGYLLKNGIVEPYLRSLAFHDHAGLCGG